MTDSGILKPLTGWQRANVLAAAQYIRDVLVRTPEDAKGRAAYDALLEVLEPARRVVRQQREMAQAAKAAVGIREKRSGKDRRAADRRKVNLGSPSGVERRKSERRSGKDRRNP